MSAPSKDQQANAKVDLLSGASANTFADIMAKARPFLAEINKNAETICGFIKIAAKQGCLSPYLLPLPPPAKLKSLVTEILLYKCVAIQSNGGTNCDTALLQKLRSAYEELHLLGEEEQSLWSNIKYHTIGSFFYLDTPIGFILKFAASSSFPVGPTFAWLAVSALVKTMPLFLSQSKTSEYTLDPNDAAGKAQLGAKLIALSTQADLLVDTETQRAEAYRALQLDAECLLEPNCGAGMKNNSVILLLQVAKAARFAKSWCATEEAAGPGRGQMLSVISIE